MKLDELIANLSPLEDDLSIEQKIEIVKVEVAVSGIEEEQLLNVVSFVRRHESCKFRLYH